MEQNIFGAMNSIADIRKAYEERFYSLYNPGCAISPALQDIQHELYSAMMRMTTSQYNYSAMLDAEVEFNDSLTRRGIDPDNVRVLFVRPDAKSEPGTFFGNLGKLKFTSSIEDRADFEQKAQVPGPVLVQLDFDSKTMKRIPSNIKAASLADSIFCLSGIELRGFVATDACFSQCDTSDWKNTCVVTNETKARFMAAMFFTANIIGDVGAKTFFTIAPAATLLKGQRNVTAETTVGDLPFVVFHDTTAADMEKKVRFAPPKYEKYLGEEVTSPITGNADVDYMTLLGAVYGRKINGTSFIHWAIDNNALYKCAPLFTEEMLKEAVGFIDKENANTAELYSKNGVKPNKFKF